MESNRPSPKSLITLTLSSYHCSKFYVPILYTTSCLKTFHFKLTGCTHFSWTPQSGGSCFLKKKPVDPDSVIYTENAICGFFVQTEEKVSNIEWLPDDSALGCDFSTPTFHSQPTVRDDCRLMCNKFEEECSHFTWKSKPGKDFLNIKMEK
jgi:hypothetical protein